MQNPDPPCAGVWINEDRSDNVRLDKLQEDGPKLNRVRYDGPNPKWISTGKKDRSGHEVDVSQGVRAPHRRS